MQIAVLTTCYNRCATTVACLEALSVQFLPQDIELTIYLVDDGCTDRTAETVMQRFPDVRVIPGDGNLYWGGGMRLAWCTASADADYDGYLWLNDDVRLFPSAISTLVMSCQEAAAIGRPGIIVGSLCDPDTGRLTYGALRRRDTLIEPSWRMQPCDTMHGNLVLVPRAVFQVVGNLSPEYRHNSGDRDYGLRAREAGFQNWVTPGFLGSCRQNSLASSWTDPTLPLRARWRSLNSLKGVPVRERYIFCRRHHGFRWPVDILKLLLRVLFPGPWQRLKRMTGRI
jgi:GT2 family glycosyltransferase